MECTKTTVSGRDAQAFVEDVLQPTGEVSNAGEATTDGSGKWNWKSWKEQKGAIDDHHCPRQLQSLCHLGSTEFFGGDERANVQSMLSIELADTSD